MSLGTLMIGFAVYQLLAGADVSYLDLEHPVSNEVLCLTRWPLRTESPIDLLDAERWREWVSYKFDEDRFIASHNCLVPNLTKVKCLKVEIPMKSVGRSLGRPLGRWDTVSYDIHDSYAWLFLLLAGWLWLQVLAHDLSLLASTNKDFVLDLSGVKEEFPFIEQAFSLIGCSSLCVCCCSCQTRAGRLAGIICMLLWAPVALVWSVAVFLGVAMPLVSIVFVCYPARMSRFGAFIASISCALYGLFLALQNLVYLCAPSTKADFAVTWEAGEQRCYCGCVYPLSNKIVWQYFVVGAVTVSKSLFLAMRCLKGLRRRNWANMLSVTFPVPVTAYAVEWTQANGEPIRFRKKEGTLKPVQGELAFDPFAMMDEQPDSTLTTLHLKPVRAKRLMYDRRGQRRQIRKLEGPNVQVQERIIPGEVIGCCGFPCRTGGMQGHFDLDGSDAESAALHLGELHPPRLSIETDMEDDRSIFSDLITPCVQASPKLAATDPAQRHGHRLCDGSLSQELAAGICSIHEDASAEAEDRDDGELFDEQVEKLGFELQWPSGNGGQPTILAVAPGGEAARRGLRRGDVIAEVNGRSTRGKPRFELHPIFRQRPLRIRVEHRNMISPSLTPTRIVTPSSGAAKGSLEEWCAGGLLRSCSPTTLGRSCYSMEAGCSPMTGMLRAAGISGWLMDRGRPTGIVEGR